MRGKGVASPVLSCCSPLWRATGYLSGATAPAVGHPAAGVERSAAQRGAGTGGDADFPPAFALSAAGKAVLSAARECVGPPVGRGEKTAPARSFLRTFSMALVDQSEPCRVAATASRRRWFRRPRASVLCRGGDARGSPGGSPPGAQIARRRWKASCLLFWPQSRRTERGRRGAGNRGHRTRAGPRGGRCRGRRWG